MRDIVKIELSGGLLKPFLALDRAGEQSIRLTTIAGFQQAGRVRVFLGRDSGNDRLLSELIFRGIPPAEAGEPDIDLHAQFDGRKTLRLRIVVGGRQYLSEDVRIRKPVHILPWLSAAAMLVLLTGLGYLFSTSFLSGSGAERAAASSPSSTGAAAPQTAARTTTPVATPAEKPVRSGSAVPAPSASSAAGTVSAAAGAGIASAGAAADPIPGTASGGASGTTAQQTGRSAPMPPSAPPSASRNSIPASAVVSERLEATVFFDADDDRVNRWAAGRLDQLIEELRRTGGRIVAIEGHTASFGSEVGREQLSLARSRNVGAYLREHGWRQPQEPEISGYGSRLPVTDREEEQHLNRRVIVRYSAENRR